MKYTVVTVWEDKQSAVDWVEATCIAGAIAASITYAQDREEGLAVAIFEGHHIDVLQPEDKEEAKS